MRILFLHQNFPAQFVHLAPALKQRGHEVVALTASANVKAASIPIHRYAYQEHKLADPALSIASHFAEHAHRGEIVARVAAALQSREKFEPDVIFGHLGWGETLFVRDIWPKARLLLYAEFFYRYAGLDADFDPEFQKPSRMRAIRTSSRQAAQLLTLHAAHAAVAPTQWQAHTYPAYLRHLISVCHDGIDTVRIQPGADAVVQLPGLAEPLRRGDEVLTFVNRNLEPYRGYHTFMRALPEVMARRPKARVVVVGSDSVSYGAPAPNGASWKQIFLDEVRDRLDLSRIHFVGHLSYEALIDLFRVTRVHAYLTYPFVLSWSMLEAMAAGAVVVGSRTGPVEEVIRDGFNGRLVDFFDVKAWSQTLVECLAEPARYEEMRRAARWTIIDRYDLRTRCLPRMIDLVESLAASSGGVVPGWGERPVVARA